MLSERISSLPLSNVSRFSIPCCSTGDSKMVIAKFCVVATLLLHKAADSSTCAFIISSTSLVYNVKSRDPRTDPFSTQNLSGASDDLVPVALNDYSSRHVR